MTTFCLASLARLFGPHHAAAGGHVRQHSELRDSTSLSVFAAVVVCFRRQLLEHFLKGWVFFGLIIGCVLIGTSYCTNQRRDHMCFQTHVPFNDPENKHNPALKTLDDETGQRKHFLPLSPASTSTARECFCHCSTRPKRIDKSG